LYIVAALFYASFFMSVGISMFMVVESVEPVIERQVNSMCNVTSYEQLMTKLSCNAAVAPAVAPAIAPAVGRLLAIDKDPCGPECESRVALITKMGGCPFLRHACNKKEYVFMGEGFCVLADGTRPPMWASAPLTPVELEACYDFCDADIQCSGVVHQEKNKVCFVITKEDSRPTGDGWIMQKQSSNAVVPIKAADGTAGAACQAKADSKLVARLKYYGFWFFFGLISFGSALIISICCTFSHMYMVNTKRKGRKGFPALCASMFCPCLRTKDKTPPDVGRLRVWESVSF